MFYFKNQELLIDSNRRCTESDVLDEISKISMYNLPVTEGSLTARFSYLEQHLAKEIPNLFFKFHTYSLCQVTTVPLDSLDSNSLESFCNRNLDDDTYTTFFINGYRTYMNKVLLQITTGSSFLVSSTPKYGFEEWYLGLKFVKDNNLVKFDFLQDCYVSSDVINKKRFPFRQ